MDRSSDPITYITKSFDQFMYILRPNCQYLILIPDLVGNKHSSLPNILQGWTFHVDVDCNHFRAMSGW